MKAPTPIFFAKEAMERAKREIAEESKRFILPGEDADPFEWIVYLLRVKEDCQARIRKGPKQYFGEKRDEYRGRKEKHRAMVEGFLTEVEDALTYYKERMERDGESKSDSSDRKRH